MTPPISSTRRLLITRPMPVPWTAPRSCPRRLNGWKSWEIFSAVNPAPVSLTLSRIRSGPRGTHSRTTVPPGWLYFTALERRFRRTCFNRVRSARTKQGRSNRGKEVSMPPFCACGSIIAWHSRITSASEVGSCDSDSFPDSICARSRISLMSSRRYQPARRISAMLPFCDAVTGVTSDSINCANPRIALSGERSSWLMLERKSDFARLAFSAAPFALVSASSTCLRSVRSRVSLANPRALPAGSRMAVKTTFAQKVDPSLRTRQPSTSHRPSVLARSR